MNLVSLFRDRDCLSRAVRDFAHSSPFYGNFVILVIVDGFVTISCLIDFVMLWRLRFDLLEIRGETKHRSFTLMVNRLH